MKKLLLLTVLLAFAIVGFSQSATNGYYTSSSGGSCGQGGYNMGPPVMTDMDMRSAMDAMDRQPFDDDKMRIAEQVIRGHAPSSIQVRELVSMLIFESSKLAFAKTAYTYVYDPQSYYLVSAAFTFSSTGSELAEYTAAIGYSNTTTWTASYGGSNGGGHCGSGTTQTGHVCGAGCNYGSACGSGSYQGGGHVCSSGCNHGTSSGGGYGQNGYYGGSSSTTYTGSGNGMTYYGEVNTTPVVPVMPMCGMCSGYHEMQFICDGEFASVADAVYGRTFDSDKISMAKQAIGTRFVSAVQVARLMGYFTFESSKLDFAKWAYRHCWDQQNYYLVNDAFTFSSSVRELDEFIRFG